MGDGHLRWIYFTDREPEYSWVALDGANQVAGYLTGTSDVRRAHSYEMRILPGIVWHVIRHRLLREQVSRRAILSMVHAMLFDDNSLPKEVAKQ